MRPETLTLALILPLAAQAAEVTREPDAKTGLTVVKARDGAFSLELIPLLPDFVGAVFSSRGLPGPARDAIAGYCAFGTVARNESRAPLAYRMADWRAVTPDGREHRFKTKTEWVREWREQGSGFKWVLLPDEQTFEVGDWSQGFSTLPLPPETVFDLHYSWSQHGTTHEGKVEGVRCAPAGPPP
jgi:hypothetical protein